MTSNYAKLRAINVNEHTEKKGSLTYLSWAWAVDQLLLQDPSANWEFLEPLHYGDTMMVRCAVTAFAKTMTCHLPVMDNRNKPISNPDAFQVNTAMMRCLAKCIALHGLGLYIYAGEDLPDVPVECITPAQVIELTDMIKHYGADHAKFVQWLKVESLEKLPANKYDAAVTALKAKGEKQ